MMDRCVAVCRRPIIAYGSKPEVRMTAIGPPGAGISMPAMPETSSLGLSWGRSLWILRVPIAGLESSGKGLFKAGYHIVVRQRLVLAAGELRGLCFFLGLPEGFTEP